MQDRPNAPELLAAVAQFLDGDVVSSLSGPLAHRVRVASNLVRVLEREQRLSAGALIRERQRLCELLGMSSDDLVPGALADQVADLHQQLIGELEAETLPAEFERAAWRVLLDGTRDKLAITRPGYDAPDQEAVG
jgi:hypothetical protein